MNEPRKTSRIYLLTGNEYTVSADEGDRVRSQMEDPSSEVIEFRTRVDRDGEYTMTVLKTAFVGLLSHIEDDE